jgi:hypothetical protein
VGAMTADGDDGDQHGEHTDGEADGVQAFVVGGVLVMLLEFLSLGGFHKVLTTYIRARLPRHAQKLKYAPIMGSAVWVKVSVEV